MFACSWKAGMPEDPMRRLERAVRKHETEWFGPRPLRAEATLFELEAAAEPYAYKHKQADLSASQIALIADAFAHIAYGYIIPETLTAKDMTRGRDSRRALDAINRSIALSRSADPLPQPLTMLQRLRIRANTLFRLRSYRPARDDLLEALRLLRQTATKVNELTPAHRKMPLELAIVALWVLSQWATIAFNLSLCARYLNGPDEALLWVDAAGIASRERASSAASIAEERPVAVDEGPRIDMDRVRRGVHLLRRIIHMETPGDLGKELKTLQDAATGDAFAGGLALVQAFVERYLVTATLRHVGLDKHDSPKPRSGFLSSIAAIFSPQKPPSSPRVPNAVLFHRVPAAAASVDPSALEQACVAAANEVTQEITEGQLEDISPCLTGHLPSFLQGSKSLATRHAIMTLIDFALTHRSSGAWRAATGFAEQREELKSLASCPSFSFAPPPEVPMQAEPLPDTVPTHDELLGAVAHSPGGELTNASFPVPPAVYELIREYTMEEELVMFEFNPVLTQQFIATMGGGPPPQPLSPSPVNASQSTESAALGQSLPAPDGDAYHLAEQLQQITDDFWPQALGSSSCILSAEQRHSLHAHLPQMQQGRDWYCTFSTRDHGTSFSTLFSRIEDLDAILLVVKPLHAAPGCAFGAYMGCPVKRNVRCLAGGGESFLFTFDPNVKRDKRGSHHPGPAIFPWSQRNSQFYESKPGYLTIGGGITGPALYLEDYLRKGSTHPCETFASPALMHGTEGIGDFQIAAVEVYAL
jgi:hypothetical protein